MYDAEIHMKKTIEKRLSVRGETVRVLELQQLREVRGAGGVTLSRGITLCISCAHCETIDCPIR